MEDFIFSDGTTIPAGNVPLEAIHRDLVHDRSLMFVSLETNYLLFGRSSSMINDVQRFCNVMGVSEVP